MRKGWQQRKIHENAWGLHFTRWYIVAPSGNHYCMYRGAYFKTIFLEKDHNDCHKSERIGKTYQEGLKHIYELEASGNYDKKLSTPLRIVMNVKDCLRHRKIIKHGFPCRHRKEDGKWQNRRKLNL